MIFENKSAETCRCNLSLCLTLALPLSLPLTLGPTYAIRSNAHATVRYVSLPPIQLSNCIRMIVVSKKLSGRNVVVLKKTKPPRSANEGPVTREGRPPELPLARPGSSVAVYLEIKSCAIIGAPFGWEDSCMLQTYVQLSYSGSRAGICVCVRRLRGILEGLQP